MVENSQAKLKLVLAFGAVYIIWGSTYLAIRYAVETIPPFLMMGIRSVIAGIVLYLWSKIQKRAEIRQQHFVPLFIIGISFFLFGHGLLAWAQQRVPSGLAAVLIASESLWIFIIETIFIRDTRVRSKGIVGLIIGFIGIIYLIASTEGINTSNADFTASLAIILSSLFWSGGAVYSRIAKLPSSPFLSAGVELIIGGIFLLIAAYFAGEMNFIRLSTISLRSVLGLGYLIVFGSVITFSAYVWLLRHTSATRISTHTYVNPIIAIVLGWIVADESLTLQLFIATTLIIISVYLVLNDQLKDTKSSSI